MDADDRRRFKKEKSKEVDSLPKSYYSLLI